MDEESRIDFYQTSNLAHKYVMARTHSLTNLRSLENQLLEPPIQRGDDSKDVTVPSIRASYGTRRYPVPSTRSSAFVPPFAKDYARIVHSPSFRRLQGKTQLIPAGENEFFRTRLTHSLEVADISMRIVRKLNATYEYFRLNPIDLELVACASLLHDIGHPPFGHSGEHALNVKMKDYGGFEGNAQTLRIVTHIENRLEGMIEIDEATNNPRGLNLTVGTLASVLKYDQESSGPIGEGKDVSVRKGYYPTEAKTVQFLRKALQIDEGTKLLTIECQIMDLADDIAYSAYDLEDTLEAGIVTPLDFMSIEDKMLEMIKKDVQRRVAKRNPNVEVTDETILGHLSSFFGTLLDYGKLDDDYRLDDKRIDRLAFVGRTYAESIQHGKNPLVRRQFLETLIEQNINSIYVDFNHSAPFLSTLKIDDDRLLLIESMKSFNFHKVIASRRLQLQHERNRLMIGDIFDRLAGDDRFTLFSDFQRERFEACDGDETSKMRLVADIIASFTDGEALNFYDQLNSTRNAGFWRYIR